MMRRAKNPDVSQANWEIPTRLRDEFTEFCKEIGDLAKDDCAGALYVWQWLPAQIREWAKLAAKTPGEPKQFWRILRKGLEAATEEGLSDYLAREPTVTDNAEYQSAADLVADVAARAEAREEKMAARDAAKKQSRRGDMKKTG